MTTFVVVLLVTLGFILAAAGIIGCIIPILPGPIFSFAGLLIISFAKDWAVFSTAFLIVMGVFTVIVTALDYVVPALGAKKYGASKWGIWMSVVGLFIGLFVFPPWGIFFGAFGGAVAGELFAGRKGSTALKAGWGVFIGNMAGIGLKLGFCAFTLAMCISSLF